MELWEHQKKAVKMLESSPFAMLALDMGTGKSRCVVEYVKKSKPSKTLIAVPLSAIGVWRGEFAKYSPEFLPFILTLDARNSVSERWRQALQWLREKPMSIIVTNYECVRMEPFASLSLEIMWDLIVADECVEMGTPILTPTGYRPIEMLIEGDEIIGEHNGQLIKTKVTHTFRGRNELERYEILGVRYTSNHPIWTTRGYIPVSELKPLDIVKVIRYSGLKEGVNGTKMLMVQEVIRRGYYLKKVLLTELCVKPSSITAGNERKDEKCDVEKQREERVSDSPFRVSALEEESIRKHRLWENNQRESKACSGAIGKIRSEQEEGRKWKAASNSATSACGEIGVGDRVYREYKEEEGKWVSIELQDRRGERNSEGGNRGGWGDTSLSETESSGREENRTPFHSWMETHAQKELPDNAGFGRNGTGSNIVCNIETGTGNYIANGLLVHNSHKIKSHSSVVSKHFGKLNRRSIKRVCLTGTPMSHSPLDVFGQYRFLNPGIYGYSFHQFKMRYGVLGGFKQKEVVAYKNLDELHRKFYSCALRVKKEDVLELPEELDENVDVILGQKTMKHYKELEKNFITEIESGVVTASNALVKLLRLQQLTGGHLGYGTEGECEKIGNEKADALEEVVEGLGDAPFVVFARFTSEILSIKEKISGMGLQCCELSGRVKELDSFQSGKAQAIVIQISSGGVGIDLTRAAYAIYFSTGFSLADYLQSRARIHRPGQTKNVTYIHLIAKDTVDEDIVDAMDKKKDVIDHVLERLKEKI